MNNKYSEQFHQNGLRIVSRGSRTISKQRNKSKSNTTSLKKRSPIDKTLEDIAEKCYHSMYQDNKFNNSLINKRYVPQSVIMKDVTKNINRNSSSVALVDKSPRTYAEIIADYSQALCNETTQNDSFYFNNIIWQSPFGTSLIPSFTKKFINAVEYDGIPAEKQENHLTFLIDNCNSANQHQQNNIIECSNLQHSNKCANEVTNTSISQEDVITTSNFKNEDQFCVKLIADCSKQFTHISPSNISNSGLIPSSVVLARNSLEFFGIPMRKVSSGNMQETLQKTIPIFSTIPNKEDIKKEISGPKKDDCIKEIESMITGLTSVSEKETIETINLLKESNVVPSMNVSNNTLDRVQKLIDIAKEPKQKEMKAAEMRLDKPRYFSSTRNLQRRNSLDRRRRDNARLIADQPQVQLCMVPSNKESIVSINVDPIDNARYSRDQQLSIIVQSRDDRRNDRNDRDDRFYRRDDRRDDRDDRDDRFYRRDDRRDDRDDRDRFYRRDDRRDDRDDRDDRFYRRDDRRDDRDDRFYRRDDRRDDRDDRDNRFYRRDDRDDRDNRFYRRDDRRDDRDDRDNRFYRRDDRRDDRNDRDNRFYRRDDRRDDRDDRFYRRDDRDDWDDRDRFYRRDDRRDDRDDRDRFYRRDDRRDDRDDRDDRFYRRDDRDDRDDRDRFFRRDDRDDRDDRDRFYRRDDRRDDRDDRFYRRDDRRDDRDDRFFRRDDRFRRDARVFRDDRLDRDVRRIRDDRFIRDDLGPVRISITEDTAPVKQVEFLINNKIISDLERITARTERLDMISLADHDAVEIRVPFDREDMLNRSLYRRDVARADLDSGKVLNVRINANFRDDNKKDDRMRNNADCAVKVGDNRIRNFRSDVYSMNNELMNTNPTKTISLQEQESSLPIHVKSKNISEEDMKKQVMSNLNPKTQQATSDNVDLKTQQAISDNVDLKTPQAISDNVDLKTQQAIAKDLSVSETMADLSLFKEAINSKAETSNTNKIANIAPSELNKHDKNESSDPHVPTKAVPWWSSSDSFSKIRKIDDDLAKPIAPILSKEKEISNLDQALVIEPLSPKSKEMIPKLQTKNEDSTYNASINNSNNLISYRTPKAFDRYPSSFRLKPNRRNSRPTPEMIKADLKTKYDQTSSILEDNKNISKRQIDLLMSSTLDTRNHKQDGQDVSIEKKISASSKDVKTTSEQNLSLKDQKQHSLEQTDLIDDESNTKSIENIIDVIKPIEKKEGNILIDYGLNVSSKKPIITLNRQKKDNQNPEIKNRKDLITGKYDQIQENAIRHDINAMKTKLEKQEIDKIILADLIKIDEKKKVGTKSNILDRKENTTVKNIAITNKEQNKTDIKNVHNNNAMTLSYPNIKDSTKLITNEKSIEDVMQDNPMQTSKLLPKYDKYDFIHTNMPKSLETIPISKQLETSAKITEELKQDEQEYLSCINNILKNSKIEESEKLNNLSSPKSKNTHHLSEEFFDGKVTETSKKFNIDANKIVNKNKPSAAQTKANSTLKNSESKATASKESINKNAGAIPINNRNNNMIKDTVTITQSPNIRSPFPKDSKNDRSQNLKSGSNKKNVSSNNADGDNSSKNTNGSNSFDSTQMRMTSMVTFIFI